jgi:hypothetical protein
MDSLRTALRDRVDDLEIDGPIPADYSPVGAPDDAPVGAPDRRTSAITVIHAKAPSAPESAQIQLELQRQISERSLQAVIAASS